MRHLYGPMIITLLVSGITHADELSVKPEPQPAGHVHVIDHEFIIDTIGMSAAWTADTVSTAQVWRRCLSCTEGGLLFTNSRSTPKIMGAWAAVDIAAVVTSYEWKKHVHNRWLHPLWRVPLLCRIEGHTAAAISNWQLQPVLN